MDNQNAESGTSSSKTASNDTTQKSESGTSSSKTTSNNTQKSDIKLKKKINKQVGLVVMIGGVLVIAATITILLWRHSDRKKQEKLRAIERARRRSATSEKLKQLQIQEQVQKQQTGELQKQQAEQLLKEQEQEREHKRSKEQQEKQTQKVCKQKLPDKDTKTKNEQAPQDTTKDLPSRTSYPRKKQHEPKQEQKPKVQEQVQTNESQISDGIYQLLESAKIQLQLQQELQNRKPIKHTELPNVSELARQLKQDSIKNDESIIVDSNNVNERVQEDDTSNPDSFPPSLRISIPTTNGTENLNYDVDFNSLYGLVAPLMNGLVRQSVVRNGRMKTSNEDIDLDHQGNRLVIPPSEKQIGETLSDNDEGEDFDLFEDTSDEDSENQIEQDDQKVIEDGETIEDEEEEKDIEGEQEEDMEEIEGVEENTENTPDIEEDDEAQIYQDQVDSETKLETLINDIESGIEEVENNLQNVS